MTDIDKLRKIGHFLLWQERQEVLYELEFLRKEVSRLKENLRQARGF